MRAFLYPGQGSQKVGMGKDLVEEFAEADEIYKQADEILGFSLSNICFEGSEEELTKTENAQPAILVYSHAATTILSNKKNVKPDFTAGHSLGEFSALLAAGMMSFPDAIRTVRKRGELMASADPDKKGTMAVVMGLEDEKVIELCKEISKEKYVEPVNFNCPGQVVISGLKEGIEIAEIRIKEAGAKRVMKLPVSGAFHSELMIKASEEFGRFLDTIELKKPHCKIVSNVTAGLEDEKNVKALLVRQIKSPVLWTDSIRFLKNNGVTDAVEVGFGNIITGLVKKIDSTINIQSWNQLLQ